QSRQRPRRRPAADRRGGAPGARARPQGRRHRGAGGLGARPAGPRGEPALVASRALLVALYLAWFLPMRDYVAAAVFALPALWLASGLWIGRRKLAMWAATLSLAWFSHGIMVAMTRPPERWPALAESALALLVLFTACLPGLKAVRDRRRRRCPGAAAARRPIIAGPHPTRPAMDQLCIVTTGGTIDKIYFDDKSDYQIGEPQIGRILDELGVQFGYRVIPILRKDSLHLNDSDRELVRAT